MPSHDSPRLIVGGPEQSPADDPAHFPKKVNDIEVIITDVLKTSEL